MAPLRPVSLVAERELVLAAPKSKTPPARTCKSSLVPIGMRLSASTPMLPTCLPPLSLERSATAVSFRIETPHTAKRAIDLRLPNEGEFTSSGSPLRPRSSLSSLVEEANVQLQELSDKIRESEVNWKKERADPKERRRRSGRSERTELAMSMATLRGNDRPMQRGDLGTEIMELLSQAGTAYERNVSPQRRLTKIDTSIVEQPQRRISTAVSREELQKREARREELAATVLSKHASRAHHQVVSKLEELRSSAEKRARFNEYCSELRSTPERVQQNIEAVDSLTPEMFALQANHRALEKQQRAMTRSQEVRQRASEIKQANEARLRRELQLKNEQQAHVVELRAQLREQMRAASWSAILFVARGTSMWAEKLLERRQEQQLVQLCRRSSKCIFKVWRNYRLRKRVKELCKAKDRLRKFVWWYRFRCRIHNKRKAVNSITAFLRAGKEASKRLVISRLLHRVRRIQRWWRHFKLVCESQNEVVFTQWSAFLQKREGLEAKSSYQRRENVEMTAEVTEMKARRTVISQYLNARRVAFKKELAEWVMKTEVWEERVATVASKNMAKEMVVGETAEYLSAFVGALGAEQAEMFKQKAIAELKSHGDQMPRKPRFSLLLTEDALISLTAKAKAKARLLISEQAASKCKAPLG